MQKQPYEQAGVYEDKITSICYPTANCYTFFSDKMMHGFGYIKNVINVMNVCGIGGFKIFNVVISYITAALHLVHPYVNDISV